MDFCEVHVSRIVLRNIHNIAHNLPQKLANHFIIPTNQYGELASECTIAGSLSMAMKATPISAIALLSRGIDTLELGVMEDFCTWSSFSHMS